MVARRRGLEPIVEISGILVTSFLLNIIPFAGPSNLFIASNAAIAFPHVNPFVVGSLVAVGSASGKFTHYLVTFFAGRYIGAERRKRLDITGMKLKKWAVLAVFLVAASPLPDEPVIIPLGLLRYNPAKLFGAYFAGKLIIGVIGAYLGKLASGIFVSVISDEALIVISIIVTIVITIVLLRINVEKLAERVLKRKIEFAPE